MRKVWPVVAAVIAGFGAMAATAGCGGARVTPEEYASATPSSLSWKPCEETATSSGFECATLEVPLDYARPEGRKIGIALVRLRATDQAQRIGSLVFNFGGPGGSGVTTLINAAHAFSTLNRRYDLVSFDPRGVERSSGVRCLSGPEMDKYISEEPSENTATETKLVKGFAQACERNAGWILPYVGTVNVARDMESLRVALGEPYLNYFGFSYGTHLGAVYATQYPKKVGRMVLDSAVDPSVTMLEMAKTQTLGFQKAYEDYLADCTKTRTSCPLGATPVEANATVLKLLDTLTRTPGKVGSRKVTEDIARVGITQALYSKYTWPLLTEALDEGRKGKLDGLLALADQYTGRQPNGSYSTLQFSLPAVLCVDSTDRPTVAQAEELARRLRERAPIFAPTAIGAGACSVWPVRGDDAARHIDATGSNPILVVGVTNDPATPYQWAPRLAEQLRTGVLLTLNGEGHGAYGQNQCIDDKVNAYLLEGKVPPEGTRCG
ncbi:peptidase [Microbispora rosea subsp. aerata]|nr:alpha/beta hydrolase [Microbispora rosea]GGO07716.1 peptidase [Microbispora rosea subsp. aerata]GIH53254.1 peptidase [Microbispora rosea subsp. aerata]GLJ83834.1 peptidase [Microbispora rosea subsp. aerata]